MLEQVLLLFLGTDCDKLELKALAFLLVMMAILIGVLLMRFTLIIKGFILRTTLILIIVIIAHHLLPFIPQSHRDCQTCDHILHQTIHPLHVPHHLHLLPTSALSPQSLITIPYLRIPPPLMVLPHDRNGRLCCSLLFL